MTARRGHCECYEAVGPLVAYSSCSWERVMTEPKPWGENGPEEDLTWLANHDPICTRPSFRRCLVALDLYTQWVGQRASKENENEK